MRSPCAVAAIALYLIVVTGCSTKPAANAENQTPDASVAAQSANGDQKNTDQTAHEDPKPLVVPAGTSITIALNSELGSKLNRPGDTFAGSIARNVSIGGQVAIPKGASINGTVTDAKALGKLAGEAVLSVRLDSVEINGVRVPMHAAVRTFTQKGKGKRTLVMTGGGAALGGLVGGLAGGGKGAAIGAAAGGGAGVGGSALTGNKEVDLPTESSVTFQLTKNLSVKR